MSGSVRLFHIADIHLGTYMGKQKPVTGAAISFHQSVFDTLAALDQVVQDVESQKPDAVVIAGDIYHRLIVNRHLLTAMTTRLSKITRVCPTIVVVGNHDIVGGTHMLADYIPLPVENLHIVSNAGVVSVTAKNGLPICFVCAGWPTTITVGEESVEDSLTEEKAKGKAEFHNYINQFAAEAAQSLPAHALKIFVGHGTMLNVYTGDEIPYMAKGGAVKDDCVFYPKNVAAYDYVALGHIHKRKVKDGKICYPGSLCVTDFAEAKDDHGYAVVEFDETRKPSISFRDIHIRPYSNITVRDDQFANEQDFISHVLSEAAPDPQRFVRLKLQITPNGLDLSVPFLYEIFEKHYGYLTIDKQYLSVEGDGKNEIPTYQPGDTTIGVVKRYLDGREDVPEELKLQALVRLRALINQG